jgi:hypothetical protein
MKPIFYFHARLSGGCNVDSKVSIDPAYGRQHFCRQMQAIISSGLAENCIVYVFMNGSQEDYDFAKGLYQNHVSLIYHGPESESLLPSMSLLQKELPNHPDAIIGFAHTKGITQPENRLYQNWLACMMRHCVEDWRRCVSDLKTGEFDAVGVHWTHNSATDPNADRWGSNSFFAGVFWWATAKYLLTLPQLPEKPIDRHSWFLPELLIGCGRARIVDYHPGPIFIHG